MLVSVDGPDLKLTTSVVLRVVGAWDDPDSDSKSDLIKPSVSLCLTLDHPFDCCSRISTLVLAASVLSMLSLVEGPDLMFTMPLVLSVEEVVSVDDPVATPSPPLVRDRKSDLINPVIPLTLTFDQPEGSCSSTSTLVPATTAPRILEPVDADDLILTPSVVKNVAAELPAGNLRKSDLI